MPDAYDAVVIGTGQAGPPLAARASSEGWRVAIVERHLLGGTCVNAGCIPTKALVASVRAVHMARRGGEFGFDARGEPVVDMKRVKARMKSISGASNERVGKWIDQMDGVDFVRGHAVLDGPNRVVVGEHVIETERVLLNVGARPRVPELAGVADVPYMTSTSVMELEVVPDHLIIVGGSYIGLEFAQIHRRLGAEVTVIEQGPRLIARDDPDVSDAVRNVLEAEGIRVRLDAECVGFARHPDGIAATVECSDGPPEIKGSHLLLAVGRVPNTDDLGLDTVGVETDQRGFITVDDQLRTTADGIWAVGDCNGRGAFTHTSYNDHEIVVANLFDDDPRRVSDRIACYGLFIDPPLGRVGMTEAQARASGRRVLVATRPMKHVGRAMHIHPTVAELVPTTLQSLGPMNH